ncbi:MAG: hypothetical protein ACJ8G4_19220 [Burkholderiales bacterium]
MKRSTTWVGILLLTGTLVSCGGGGGGGGDNPGTTPGTPNGGTPPPSNGSVSTPGRFEESDAAVTLSGAWTPTNSSFGWSGGTAMETTTAGATATFTFTGTSVRWIGARNRQGGIALVSVDGGKAKRADLFARPNETRTPIITLDGLTAGRHTLTIQVTDEKNAEAPSDSPGVVVVDAFDVDAPIVSHLQETDPDLAYTGTWDQDDSAAWSGGGVASLPDSPHGGARFTTSAGAKITLKFRGTSITWQSGRGPDYGIASVQVDGGAPTDVDTYSPSQKYQDIVFKATGLADAPHTLTVQATGRKNPASAGAKIVVDAFDVTTPGRRFQQDAVDPVTGAAMVTYTGKWVHGNVNRVWSEGSCDTSTVAGSKAIFHFTGTSVSWIGCQKESCSGVAKVSIDGAEVKVINNWRPVPIEAYQHEVFRSDKLTPGVHTLTIEQTVNTGYIVVDAFDVRQ